LKWIVGRIRGTAQAVETPVGWIPAQGEIDLNGLDVSPAQFDAALAVNNDEWRQALEDLGTFYDQIGDRMPPEILKIYHQTLRRL
jgi:phosphoenolpyruvate carboxykinase (GTP)